MTALVVDTSAVVAVLLEEPGAERLVGAIEEASALIMAAPTLVELGMVMEAKKGAAVGLVVEQFLRDLGVEVVPFDASLAHRALEGWRRFGKGRHPASLNLGDCYAYALAVDRGLPVLCVGDDFAATDVAVAPVASPG